MALINNSKAIKLIKKALSSNGWNQKKLAEEAGLSDSTISRCLRGDLLISKNVAERIADTLSLDKSKLVEAALLDKLRTLRGDFEDYPSAQNRLDKSLVHHKD